MAWLVVGSLMLVTQPVWAARTQVHEAAESQEYGRKFGGMIGRGLLNGATCFVDVLVNVVNETKAGPPFVGTLTGLAKGTGCGVLRLGSGVVDLVTFWVPGFNGFPVSDSYDNCLASAGGAAGASYGEPGAGQSTSIWDVPTTEPGAAQAPVPAESAPARPWKK
jgi:putative exosortase-associated protein (TIGR04073 family)